MKAHCYYHDQLVAKKNDFIKPDGSLNYPCLGSFSKSCWIFADLLPLNFFKRFFWKRWKECDKSFDNYSNYSKHKNEVHAEFKFACRFPDCDYRGQRLNRIDHWKNIHANPGFHCEVVSRLGIPRPVGLNRFDIFDYCLRINTKVQLLIWFRPVAKK